MPDLLERDRGIALRPGGDERLARVELRRQIGRLERQLGELVAEGFQRQRVETAVAAASSAPRVLGLGDLEAIRDSLAQRVGEAQRALSDRDDLERCNHELLERMLAAPADYKWLQISRDDLGLAGCGHWHSRPRYGLLGMLMGWWRVRISSGCPLAGRLAAVERESEETSRR
jgi:hypothetical protein